jgi:hypothetical protein
VISSDSPFLLLEQDEGIAVAGRANSQLERF